METFSLLQVHKPLSHSLRERTLVRFMRLSKLFRMVLNIYLIVERDLHQTKREQSTAKAAHG